MSVARTAADLLNGHTNSLLPPYGFFTSWVSDAFATPLHQLAEVVGR
jgi:hypothetical protein